MGSEGEGANQPNLHASSETRDSNLGGLPWRGERLGTRSSVGKEGRKEGRVQERSAHFLDDTKAEGLLDLSCSQRARHTAGPPHRKTAWPSPPTTPAPLLPRKGHPHNPRSPSQAPNTLSVGEVHRSHPQTGCRCLWPWSRSQTRPQSISSRPRAGPERPKTPGRTARPPARQAFRLHRESAVPTTAPQPDRVMPAPKPARAAEASPAVYRDRRALALLSTPKGHQPFSDARILM